MCSETSEAVGTTWEYAQLEFQNFLKIRITLILDGGSLPSSGISRHFSLKIPIFLDVVFFEPESQESDLTWSFCFSCCPFRSKNPGFSYLIFVLFSSRLFCFPLLLVSIFCFALKLVSLSKELYFFFLSFSNGIELLFIGGALFTCFNIWSQNVIRIRKAVRKLKEKSPLLAKMLCFFIGPINGFVCPVCLFS